MAKKEIYTVRSAPTDTPSIQRWRILKCDFEFNETGSYDLSKAGTQYNCSCFAGNKEICRHRTMLIEFEVEQRIDSNWWYNFDLKKGSKWIEGPKQET